ncbi:esterase LipI-like [Sycon ciliatum]|uniref:esterase LipI-like n=1 Tax=Sycon ciliatum TaxID=27933 RepID=UPI0031F6E1EA
MACGRCCLVLLSTFAVLLAIALYPLSQWDENIAMKTRISGRILDMFILPRPSVNFLSVLAFLRGTSRPEASRHLMSVLSSIVDTSYVSSEGRTVAGVPVRLYRPATVDADAVLPVLVYFHGGGFITGHIDAYDNVLANWCRESDIAVISVDYRLAPEHVFPAAFDDCFAVTKAVLGDQAVAAALRVNSSLVSVGGDSAGGSLAAAVALHISRVTSLPRVRAQVSIFPTMKGALDDPETALSFWAPGGLTPEMMFLFRAWYLGGMEHYELLYSQLTERSLQLLPAEVWKNASLRLEGVDVELVTPDTDKYPYAERFLSESMSPLLSQDLSTVPPTIILLAGIDPLYSDGLLYERRLKSAGVEVELVEYKNQIHGFFAFVPTNITVLGATLPYGNAEALDAMKQSVRFVLDHL